MKKIGPFGILELQKRPASPHALRIEVEICGVKHATLLDESTAAEIARAMNEWVGRLAASPSPVVELPMYHVGGCPKFPGVAYYNGLGAYGRGWHVKDCPHEPGRVERRYWRQGYAYARRLDRYRRRALRRAGDYSAWPPRREA